MQYLPKSNQQQTLKTLRVTVQEALVLPTQDVIETNYKVNFFCRVPADWIENERLKNECWNQIREQIFGADRRAEIFPGARYIIKSAETEIFDDEQVKTRNWRDIVETDDDLFYFFVVTENGEAEKVTAQEFQEETTAYFQDAAETGAARPGLLDLPPELLQPWEPVNLNELDASLVEAWREPEKLPAADLWFDQTRSETAQAQYGYIILKKHLRRENLELRPDKLPGSFWSLGWSLYMNTDAPVRETKHAQMLKAMFAELVDFCRIVSGEYFAYRLKELFEKMIDGLVVREELRRLLPDKALDQISEIERMLDEEYQDYLERANQMGY